MGKMNTNSCNSKNNSKSNMSNSINNYIFSKMKKSKIRNKSLKMKDKKITKTKHQIHKNDKNIFKFEILK